MLFLICYLLGWFVGITVILADPVVGSSHSIFNTLLTYHLTISVGLMGFLGAYGYLFLSDKVARQIGWQEGSLFQIELGYCCLGMGILGVLCFWIRDYFWLATIIFTSVFLLGAAILHIKEMLHNNNFNAGNSISTIPDILIPLTLIILWLLK